METQLRKWLHEIQLFDIFSISDEWGKAQPMVGYASASSVRKEAEQSGKASH